MMFLCLNSYCFIPRINLERIFSAKWIALTGKPRRFVIIYIYLYCGYCFSVVASDGSFLFKSSVERFFAVFLPQMVCQCYGRLPCLGGLLDRGVGAGRAEGWTTQIHCLLASANGLLDQIYQGSETGTRFVFPYHSSPST